MRNTEGKVWLVENGLERHPGVRAAREGFYV
jgi:hypothetical protein